MCENAYLSEPLSVDKLLGRDILLVVVLGAALGRYLGEGGLLAEESTSTGHEAWRLLWFGKV